MRADMISLMVAAVELPLPTAGDGVNNPPLEDFIPYSNGSNMGFVAGDVWIFVNSDLIETGHCLTIQPVHLYIV